MVWVLFGPMTPFIAEQIHLSATQKGLADCDPVARWFDLPAHSRILADRVGGRRAGLIGLSLTLVPLFSDGISLRLCGSSISSDLCWVLPEQVLPLLCRWPADGIPPSTRAWPWALPAPVTPGTLIITFFGSRLAQHFGWHAVFGMALLPVALVLAVFFFAAKNSPTMSAPRAWNQYARLLAQGDTWRLCFLYSLTFGGFLGLASFLTVFFHDQYHLTKVQAGDYTTLVVLSGSFLRPVGGWLADKIGGYRLLLGIFLGVAVSLMILSSLPPLAIVVPMLFLSMGMLGMGNGAIFQIAPQRFLSEIELITGIVGAAGGLGGFFLPSALGALKDISGSYGTGLLCFALLVAPLF